MDLFKCDNIAYTLVPVGSISELKSAYEENKEEVKFVVLINCGGTIDLVDVLQPDEDVVFFVLDAHKPTDVCNVYSDGQVRISYFTLFIRWLDRAVGSKPAYCTVSPGFPSGGNLGI